MSRVEAAIPSQGGLTSHSLPSLPMSTIDTLPLGRVA
jgi:hypothetical protein